MVNYNFKEDYDRVIFDNNPLVDVILRIDFTQTLEVDVKEHMAQFQKKIKTWFPHYSPREEIIKNPISDLLNLKEDPKVNVMHEFISKDRTKIVILTSKAFIINFKKYTEFKEFENTFKNNWKVFDDIFSPAMITRIGLRYVNLIEKSKINVQNEEFKWSEMINESLVPELGAYMKNQDSSYVTSVNKDLNLVIDGDPVRLKLAILKSVNKSDSPEEAFLIDIDFYSENNEDGIEKGGINERFKQFNNRTRKIFRPFLTDKLFSRLSKK